MKNITRNRFGLGENVLSFTNMMGEFKLYEQILKSTVKLKLRGNIVFYQKKIIYPTETESSKAFRRPQKEDRRPLLSGRAFTSQDHDHDHRFVVSTDVVPASLRTRSVVSDRPLVLSISECFPERVVGEGIIYRLFIHFSVGKEYI